MTSLSLAEGCRLLAIDPKTLRQWLVQAQMALHTDPMNAKIKCVTGEQVQTLAHLHGRVLKPETVVSAVGPGPMPSEAQSQVLPTVPPDTGLQAKLVQMEAQIATLQAQLTDLALQLLREREQRMEQLVLTLQAPSPLTRELASQVLSVPSQRAMPALVCHPTEQRSRLIPLIEYGASGRYVLICPKEGELLITPDSPEWFAWLASLTSCAFCGPVRPL